MTATPSTNTDFTRPVAVDASALAWQPSPSPTVWRKTLYRDGGEYGPVTSIVRYDADSRFAPHVHPEGEEILVLNGVFSDEHGDYPAGTYLLNPEGTRHSPSSKNGCLLFVHLRQYQGKMRLPLLLDTNALAWSATDVGGITEKQLYRQDGFAEAMTLQRWSGGTSFAFSVAAGTLEILVIDGAIMLAGTPYRALSWMRLPAATGAYPLYSADGALLYVRRTGQREN